VNALDTLEHEGDAKGQTLQNKCIHIAIGTMFTGLYVLPEPVLNMMPLAREMRKHVHEAGSNDRMRNIWDKACEAKRKFWASAQTASQCTTHSPFHFCIERKWSATP
jgi:hypothetical protein